VDESDSYVWVRFTLTQGWLFASEERGFTVEMDKLGRSKTEVKGGSLFRRIRRNELATPARR